MPVAYFSTASSATQVVKVRSSPVYDKQNGVVWTDEYVGTNTGIGTLANMLAALGARVQTDYTGGPAKLTAVFARDPSVDSANEIPADEYRIRAEGFEESLFAFPAVIAEGTAYTGGMAAYKKYIEDSVKNGVLASPGPYGQIVYNLLARGIESIRRRRIILSRVRRFSVTYSGVDSLDAAEKVWTTARLVHDFAIPIAVQNKLPATPSGSDTPTGTTWGWLIVDDESTYLPKTNQFEEHKTWAFAAWVNGLYNLQS